MIKVICDVKICGEDLTDTTTKTIRIGEKNYTLCEGCLTSLMKFLDEHLFPGTAIIPSFTQPPMWGGVGGSTTTIPFITGGSGGGGGGAPGGGNGILWIVNNEGLTQADFASGSAAYTVNPSDK